MIQRIHGEPPGSELLGGPPVLAAVRIESMRDDDDAMGAARRMPGAREDLQPPEPFEAALGHALQCRHPEGCSRKAGEVVSRIGDSGDAADPENGGLAHPGSTRCLKNGADGLTMAPCGGRIRTVRWLGACASTIGRRRPLDR